MNKILVDTNVLVYAVDEDSKFHNKSLSLIQNTNYDLYTTSKNLSEFLVVLTKSTAVTLTVKDILKSFNAIISHFTVLYPSPKSYKMFTKLLSKYNPKGLIIHDFEIMSIVLAHEISQIATMNVVDFKRVEEIQLIEF
jgi:predicted nucleic acid-binding protein